jgi:hypothetical protein
VALKTKKPEQGEASSGFRICGRGERIRTSGLYVPNVALYRAKLHPDWFEALTNLPQEVLI